MRCCRLAWRALRAASNLVLASRSARLEGHSPHSEILLRFVCAWILMTCLFMLHLKPGEYGRNQQLRHFLRVSLPRALGGLSEHDNLPPSASTSGCWCCYLGRNRGGLRRALARAHSRKGSNPV